MVKVVEFKHKSSSLLFTLWDSGSATISNLESKIRRQGHASELLKRTIKYADFAKLKVVLRVDSSDPEAMNNHQLIEFYSRFGFEGQFDPELTVLERTPR